MRRVPTGQQDFYKTRQLCPHPQTRFHPEISFLLRSLAVIGQTSDAFCVNKAAATTI